MPTKKAAAAKGDKILGAVRLHNGDTLSAGQEEELAERADTLTQADFKRLRKLGVIRGFDGKGSKDAKAQAEAITAEAEADDEDEDEEEGTIEEVAEGGRGGMSTNPDGTLHEVDESDIPDPDDEEEESTGPRGGAKGGAKKTASKGRGKGK